MPGILFCKHLASFYEDKNINNAYLSDTGSLPLIRFRCFDGEDWMDAAMTTRLGGVSSGFLSSLNLGDNRGDDPKNVKENFRRVAKALDIEKDFLIRSDQVHDTKIELADKKVLPAGPEIKPFPDTDGLFCNTPGITLSISVADCVPVFLADPITRSISLVHSGWRGTVGEISKKAVGIMSERGANPEDIIALIGPSISVYNYEVSKDVMEEFELKYSPLQMKDIVLPGKDSGHFYLDLWAACWHTLSDSGLIPQNIYFSSVCTYENNELLYSHRYTNGKRGNQNALMHIRPSN